MRRLQKIFISLFLLTFLMNYSLVFAATNLPSYVEDKNILEYERMHLISLEGTSNARDLGGYLTLDYKKTKSGIFIRADDTMS